MYPDNLLYFVKKLQGYSRNNVKVLPLTSTTSGPGQVIQFRLPTNSLIDLSTWCLHGNLTVAGTGAEVNFGRDTASMIRNVQVQIGGQTIQNLNQYNLVWQALKQSTMSTSASASNKWLEYDANVVAVGNNNQSTKSPFVVRNWLGFFQSSPSILDTSLVGEIVISLTIETDPLKFCINEAGTTAVTLALTELFSSIDLISIQDGVYDMVAKQALASGLMLEIPVPNYFTFLHSATSDSYDTQFTIGCQSLDAAMVLQRLQGKALSDNATVSSANGYKIQIGLRFDGATATTTDGDGWYFEVNGAQVPSHRVNRHNTPYYQKLAFGIHGADHGNLHGTEIKRDDATTGWTAADVTLMESAQYIPVVRFNHAASDKRLLSGIDARSNPVQIAFHHKSDGNTAPKDVSVVALCTSTLMVGAGQQLSFSA